MYRKIIRNEFLKSRLITLTTILFVAAAALLVSLAAVLGINLTGAIDQMMLDAKTPHFMQMHTGEADIEKLNRFARQNKDVDEFQILEFLNIDNAKISFGDNSLSGSTQDNGLSVQSGQFDYLLDLDGEIIHVSDGEIYVPICYMKDHTAELGGKADICGREFVIAGFLRDSQMNSMLSSSKRFLVSEHDYAELSDSGNAESLIEFRLKDKERISAFEAAYAAEGVPANGPAVTWSLFKMLNAISDGIMIGIILLVSILVVMIALLCIRFTLLAKIEDDYREIGVMKAIGLRLSDIRRIYLTIYAVIALAGCTLGYLLSFVFRDRLTQNIRLMMGESPKSSLAGLVGLAGSAMIAAVILLYVSSVLRRFRKISAAEAIRYGVSGTRCKKTAGPNLYKNQWINTNVLLGIKDVLTRKGMYVTMLTALVFAAFILIVPQNLYSTVSSESFASYMGIGRCDLRADIQQTDDIPGKTAEIGRMMSCDSRISKYTILTTKAFKIKTEDGSAETIKVELGDHSVFPIAYSKGRAPAGKDEIALSAVNAEELGKKIGDILVLHTEEGEKRLTVCGIYSDITNGGKTAKAVFHDSSAEIMWTIIYAAAADKAEVHETVSDYAGRFDYAKITDTKEYISQTYGQTLNAVKMVSITSAGAAVLIIVLVTILFMKMLVAKDRYDTAVMKAFGFTDSDIRLQYISRAIFVLVIGIVLGTILANTLGEVLAGIMISSFGASSFEFIINPVSAYILSPLIMLCSLLAAALLGAKDAGKIKISENIKE